MGVRAGIVRMHGGPDRVDAGGAPCAARDRCYRAQRKIRLVGGLGRKRSPMARTPVGESGPTLLGALQEQLGLKLEAKKTTIEILVVDKVEKAPTEIE